MAFKEDLKIKSAYIEDLLKEYMPKEEGYQHTIFKAMNYSLSAGGKRLRPVLTLEAAKIVGGDQNDAIPFCVAIEMIHTYSLIHDDLPAMDNDDFRRGKPTNHKVFGDGMATLAGDALLNYAFEIMLKESIGKSNSDISLKAIYEIARGAGIYGMIGGQVVDIESEDKSIEKEKLDFIHMNKTAAMIVGGMRAGAIIGQASKDDLQNITKYAKNIGLAFQIIDDILDIVGDAKILGKPIGSDLENHKSTYPALIGLDESRKVARDLIEEAKDSIRKVSGDSSFLEELAEYIISRDH